MVYLILKIFKMHSFISCKLNVCHVCKVNYVSFISLQMLCVKLTVFLHMHCGVQQLIADLCGVTSRNQTNTSVESCVS